jgi:hypothetical protein
MQNFSSRVARLFAYDPEVIDTYLPRWARRSNPVVRRHLGLYWRVLPPDWEYVERIYLFEALLMAFTLAMPYMFQMIAALSLTSFALIPLLVFFYARVVVYVSHDAAVTMVSEVAENTIMLIRTTPASLTRILLSKASAAVWRRIEDLGLVIWGAVFVSLPLAAMHVGLLYNESEQLLFTRALVMVIVAASVARLVFEPLMFAAMGLLFGTLVPHRVGAATWGLAYVVLYFLIINAPRLLILTPTEEVLLLILLPAFVPLVMTALAFFATVRSLLKE